MASAWSLRKLNLPETMENAFSYLNRIVALTPNDPRNLPPRFADGQLSQLIQFLGTNRYQPAERLFRELITKKKSGMETRIAAIWSLGRFHPNDPIPKIVGPLIGRLNAVHPGDMESAALRRMLRNHTRHHEGERFAAETARVLHRATAFPGHR